MALTLREKAERQIERLNEDIEKARPRYEKALGRIERRREIYARQTAAMAAAEARFAKYEARREEALRYIDALQAAMGEDVSVPEEKASGNLSTVVELSGNISVSVPEDEDEEMADAAEGADPSIAV